MPLLANNCVAHKSTALIEDMLHLEGKCFYFDIEGDFILCPLTETLNLVQKKIATVLKLVVNQIKIALPMKITSYKLQVEEMMELFAIIEAYHKIEIMAFGLSKAQQEKLAKKEKQVPIYGEEQEDENEEEDDFDPFEDCLDDSKIASDLANKMKKHAAKSAVKNASASRSRAIGMSAGKGNNNMS